jgi:lysophospholipase L1-like esterase
VKIMVAGIIGVAENYVWAPGGNIGQVQAYNALVEAYADQRKLEGKNIQFVDMYSAMNYGSDTTDFTIDNNTDAGTSGPGLHPSFTGYEKMADVWYSALIPEPTLLGLPVLCLALLGRRARRV